MEALRSLWKIVFNDSDPFLDRFFQHLFHPGECFLTRTDSHISSMLFLLEATLSGRKGERPMRYVYACATHPDYRNRGLMGQLLEAATAYAGEQHFDLAVVPADASLFDYYKRFGFTQPIYLYRRAYPPLTVAKAAIPWQKCLTTTAEMVQMLQTLRSRFWRGKEVVLWPDKHIETVLEELFSENGELLLLKTGDLLPFGYALSLPRGGKIEIVECASVFPQDETITSLRSYYKEQETLFTLSSGIEQVVEQSRNAAETPFGLLYSSQLGQSPYLNLALDV